MALRAIIPVAGVGTRLRPHTHIVPKALLTVADQPILGHILDGLLAAGVTEVVLVVGYRGEQIVEYIRTKSPNLSLRWVRQEEPLGLGHAIWCARHYLDGSPALIVLGDTIVELNWQELFRQPDNVVGVKEVEDPRRFGVVLLRDGMIEGFVEKPEEPPSNLALVGVYMIADTAALRTALEELLQRGLRTRGEYQLTDALELMRRSGVRFRPFVVQTWYDCGKVETLLETNRHLLHRRSNHPELPGCAVIPPVYIAPSAQVEHSVIGPYVAISEGARVRFSIVRDAIINAGASLEAVVLEQSVIGANALVCGRFQRVNVADDSEIRWE
ncbi:UTP--glucose-1-phosphate uridylyltransferase [bacterium HR21]|jgi:glucose-1-phosphate thymidylyltransferase|nr:UTP--glucose-1-phosphate uridylyltransferase [bacterium HR21]